MMMAENYIFHDLTRYQPPVDEHKKYSANNNNTRGAINHNRSRSFSRSNSITQIEGLSKLPVNATAKRRGSLIKVQKLRESKWFEHSEVGILCAVVENGFIVECVFNEDESRFGIAIWVEGKEKSKDAHYLTIYTIIDQKVEPVNLMQFWPSNIKIKINNNKDKDEDPFKECVIKEQIKYSTFAKKKWTDSQEFASFCRYGPHYLIDCRKKEEQGIKWLPRGLLKKIRSISFTPKNT